MDIQADRALVQRDLTNPIDTYLRDLWRRISSDTDGQVADYIPELGLASPDEFGIAMTTTDGRDYMVGHFDRKFTIQSVSKPFLYAYALREYDRDLVNDHVGVEPTGEAFNSIILDDGRNRPFNPMVNTGAIAVAELMKGEDRAERERNMLALFEQFAGRPMSINRKVFESERDTGHRNRAIAYMMLNTSMISRDPEDLLDLYFKQCSVDVDCVDLSTMAATLANYGVNPKTGEKVLEPEAVRDVLTVMNTCGMYNYAGQWAYEVGIPAKSGVAGGVIAVIPGQLGVGIYSPPLDQHGNSVRGVNVCKEISGEFGLHVFHHRTNVQSVIRNSYRGSDVSSKTLRTPRERDVLKAQGNRIAVLELQSALFFGSAERVLREVSELVDSADYLIVDFKRVHIADQAAVRLIIHMTDSLAALPIQVAYSHVIGNPKLDAFDATVLDGLRDKRVQLFERTDEALEQFENQILAQSPHFGDRTKFALSQLDAFAGIDDAELAILEDIVRPMQFSKGDDLITEGDDANAFFVIARGQVNVMLTMPDGTRRRISSIGPGLTVGEMALLDGGKRSASVVADETVICYALSVEDLNTLGENYPSILVTIMRNLAREFSERLRRANDEVRALE